MNKHQTYRNAIAEAVAAECKFAGLEVPTGEKWEETITHYAHEMTSADDATFFAGQVLLDVEGINVAKLEDEINEDSRFTFAYTTTGGGFNGYETFVTADEGRFAYSVLLTDQEGIAPTKMTEVCAISFMTIGDGDWVDSHFFDDVTSAIAWLNATDYVAR